MAHPDRFRPWACLPRLAIVAAVGLAGARCTYTTDAQSPGGTLVVQRPGTLPSLPPAAPPATPPAVASGPAAPPPSGVYEGVARATSSRGGTCRTAIPIRLFTVSGDTVRYRGFRGTIQSDMHLKMQAGNSFIHGDFDGGRFVGRYWRPGPSCTYDLVLDHVG